jgi:hypothetical protein
VDEVARRYLELALSLDRHVEGFVDAYFGPPEIKAQAEAVPPRHLDELAAEAVRLLASLASEEVAPQRQEYLSAQVRAMQTVIAKVAGQELDFKTEVERTFDLSPAMVDDSTFAAAHAEMARVLPGSGDLRDRLEDWKKQQELPPDRVLPVFDLALAETRRRTLTLFELPAGEDLSMQVVKDQPWSAYNWYLGNYRSRIELNTDLPLRASSAVPLLAHEAYAGHHTEHAIKEQKLYREEGRAEHSVQLLLAPECVLSEGIADSARQILFEDEELVDFLGEVIYPAAGLPGFDAERQVRLAAAAMRLRGVEGNAALLLHLEGRPEEEVQSYVEHWGLRSPREAAQALRFIQAPLYRSYIFNYALGRELLAPLLTGSRARENYRRLLAEALTPSGVRRWIAREQSSA